jgi:hypothetical protein
MENQDKGCHTENHAAARFKRRPQRHIVYLAKALARLVDSH